MKTYINQGLFAHRNGFTSVTWFFREIFSIFILHDIKIRWIRYIPLLTMCSQRWERWIYIHYRQKAPDPLVRNRRDPRIRCSASWCSTRSYWKCTCDVEPKTPGTRYSDNSQSSPVTTYGEHCFLSAPDTRRLFLAASSNNSHRNL